MSAAFTWHPRDASGADPLTIYHDEDYAGYAVLHVPHELLGEARDVTLTRPSGEHYVAVELRLPARALAEFGLRAARDRVEVILERLLDDLDSTEVTS